MILPFIMVTHAGSYAIMRWIGGYDARDAYFASLPGGIVDSIALAEQAGTFHVERCRGLPPQASLLARAAGASACDPFVEVTVVSKTVFGQSVKTCRTRVRRFSTDPLYDETFALKAYHQTRTALITVYNWARGVEGRRLGQVEVEVQDPKNRRPRWHRLRDARGRRAGDVRLRVAFDPLDEAEISKTAEVTVVADGFCHLYELSFGAQAGVKRYIRGLRLTLAKRLETLDDAPAVAWRPAAGAQRDVDAGGFERVRRLAPVEGRRRGHEPHGPQKRYR